MHNGRREHGACGKLARLVFSSTSLVSGPKSLQQLVDGIFGGRAHISCSVSAFTIRSISAYRHLMLWDITQQGLDL